MNNPKENLTTQEQELLKEIEKYKAQQRIAKLKEELTNLKNPSPVSKFDECRVCKMEFLQLFKLHIANYEDEGINPRVISKVCQNCKDNKVIQANFYCPLTSDGYDG